MDMKVTKDTLIGDMLVMDRGIAVIPVSYTHLDVYKRQVKTIPGSSRLSPYLPISCVSAPR